MSPRFEWIAQNTDRVARHGVETFEVEEAMTDPRRIGFAVHDRDKKGTVGRTETAALCLSCMSYVAVATMSLPRVT